MNNVDHVLAAALQLPATERAAVVAELLESLDDLGPADEARRCLAEVDAGTVTPIPWAEARRRILAAANGRRETP